MASSDRIARTISTVAGMVLALLLGYAMAHYNKLPQGLLQALGAPFAGPPQPPVTVLPMLRTRFPLPQRHGFAGVRTMQPLREGLADQPLLNGVTLLSGHFPEGDFAPGIRAIARDGSTLHHWNADPARIWSDGIPADDVRRWFLRDDAVASGMTLLEGDMVVALHGLGVARLAPDGSVRWRLDRQVRGPVTPAPDGGLWVAAWNWRNDGLAIQKEYPGLRPPIADDLLLELDPETGEVLGEVPFLPGVIARGDLHQQVLKYGDPLRNITGIEDVQVLPEDLAPAFPGLAAGDLVVTLRPMGVVAAIAPDTGTIKWWRNLPVINPAGTCFLPSGEVAVLDLNADSSPLGQVLGGSRILAVQPRPDLTGELGGDPGSDDSRHVYPPLGDRRLGAPVDSRVARRRNWYFTNTGGSLQPLPGNRWLLAESEAGRVIEVGAGGALLWEYAVETLPEEEAAPLPGGRGRVYPIHRAIRLPQTPEQLQARLR